MRGRKGEEISSFYKTPIIQKEREREKKRKNMDSYIVYLGASLVAYLIESSTVTGPIHLSVKFACLADVIIKCLLWRMVHKLPIAKYTVLSFFRIGNYFYDEDR